MHSTTRRPGGQQKQQVKLRQGASCSQAEDREGHELLPYVSRLVPAVQAHEYVSLRNHAAKPGDGLRFDSLCSELRYDEKFANHAAKEDSHFPFKCEDILSASICHRASHNSVLGVL